jgi:hypothetical protein
MGLSTRSNAKHALNNSNMRLFPKKFVLAKERIAKS